MGWKLNILFSWHFNGQNDAASAHVSVPWNVTTAGVAAYRESAMRCCSFYKHDWAGWDGGGWKEDGGGADAFK